MAGCGHVWRAKVAGVVRETGCPNCKNKTEARVHAFMRSFEGPRPWSVLLYAGYGWAVHVMPLHFDIAVRDATGRLVLIEVDGGQHFHKVLTWDTDPDVVRSRDVYKAYCALTAGARISHVVGIVRLHQEDVWGGRFEWKQPQSRILLPSDLLDETRGAVLIDVAASPSLHAVPPG